MQRPTPPEEDDDSNYSNVARSKGILRVDERKDTIQEQDPLPSNAIQPDKKGIDCRDICGPLKTHSRNRHVLRHQCSSATFNPSLIGAIRNSKIHWHSEEARDNSPMCSGTDLVLHLMSSSSRGPNQHQIGNPSIHRSHLRCFCYGEV